MRLAEIRSLVRVVAPRPGGAARLTRIVSIEDLRRAARRSVPRAVFDSIDGGAEGEVTLRRNVAAFERLELLPRILRDVSDVDTRTTLLGTPSAVPFALGPAGYTRVADPSGGELAVARAAAKAEIPYCLSTVSSTSIEQTAAAGDRMWFQLYVQEDRGVTRELVARAREAGYRALLVTVDALVTGGRERDRHNAFTIPPTVGPRSLVDAAFHPRWWWRFVTSPPVTFANLGDEAAVPGVLRGVGVSPWMVWSDLEWIVDEWDGPIALKGVMAAADAERAAEAGVSVIVSNHGGRQLDHVPATIEVLPEIVDAVGGRVDVYLDSGIRRGTDVVKALALGAKGVLVVRPYLYGLAAEGESGAAHAIALLAAELRRAMAHLGATRLDDLSPEMVRPRATR
ncbi:MAG TPA: alpha-hydroxy acid oxidase [Actinomycetota bacterium]|nr:alpha-hydroxy acid oxidase [Actinomycetota bacterium]